MYVLVSVPYSDHTLYVFHYDILLMLQIISEHLADI